MEVARLQFPPKHRKTHWKLNSSILEHDSFLIQFTKVFRQVEEAVEDYDDFADWWDLYAKPACTSFCKSFSSSLAKQKKIFKPLPLAWWSGHGTNKMLRKSLPVYITLDKSISKG